MRKKIIIRVSRNKKNMYAAAESKNGSGELKRKQGKDKISC